MIKGPLELAGHGRGRLASERRVRTRYSHTIATRCRVKRAIHRCVVDKVRGRTDADGPSQVEAGDAALDPRSTESVGGREGGKEGGPLVVWWSTTPLASGAPLGE